MSTSTTNYNFIKDDPIDYYDVLKLNTNLDLIDNQIKANEIAIDQLEDKSTYKEVTLSNHAAIFSSGVGTDKTGKEQNFNSIVEGQSNVKLKGFTANNLVKNGDFSNGITNWVVSSDISYTVNDKVLSFTGVRQFNQVIQFIPTIIGHKYYISAYVKADDKKVSINFNYASKTIFHSGSGNYELLSGVFDTDSSNTALNVVDNRSSDWSEISVSNMMCFDLTSTFGAGNEPTKKQCDIIFDHYTEGLVGTGYGKIVSVGKNIFGSKFMADTMVEAVAINGAYCHLVTKDNRNAIAIYGKSQIHNKIIFYKFKPNTQYTFRVWSRYDEAQDVPGALLNINYVDGTSDHIVPNSNSWKEYILTTPIGKSVLSITSGWANNGISYFDYDTFQTEEGAEFTGYEPYKSSELKTSLPRSLHRLPNGIYDSVENINGIKTAIFKTSVVTLKSDTFSWTGFDATSNNTIRVELNYGLEGIANINSTAEYSKIVPTHIFTDGMPVRDRDSLYNNDVEGISIYGYNAYGHLFVRVAKNKLSTIDLAGFIAWLSNNPIKVVYQRAIPQIFVNGTGEFNQTGNLEVYPIGTIYQFRENYPESYNNAILDITYNLSDKAIMMSNSHKITALNKEKLSANGIANNLITTEQGLVLDARQGKVLSDKITLLNSNKTTGSSSKFILNTLGWYRIAQYKAYSHAQVKGAACNSVGIDIKRMYNYANNEYYKLLLMSICDKSQWLKIGKLINTQVITKIRHTVDTSAYIAYIEIYYNFNKESEFGIELSNTKDGSVYVTSAWETITPIATSETVDNVITMSTLDLTTA